MRGIIISLMSAAIISGGAAAHASQIAQGTSSSLMSKQESQAFQSRLSSATSDSQRDAIRREMQGTIYQRALESSPVPPSSSSPSPSPSRSVGSFNGSVPGSSIGTRGNRGGMHGVSGGRSGASRSGGSGVDRSAGSRGRGGRR